MKKIKTNKELNRRQILKGALGFVGATASAKAFAQTCSGITPSQPEGPFYPTHKQIDKDFDMTKVADNELLAPKSAQGEHVYIKGKVLDENCKPIVGALVDLWQACHTGKYLHQDDPNNAELDPNFQYWAKVKTNEQGEWMVKTIIPGAYPANNNWIRPPHIHFKVSKLGYHTLTTQMYFDDPRFAELNSKDPLLQSIPESEQSKVLIRFKKELPKAGPFEEPKINTVGYFDIGLVKI